MVSGNPPNHSKPNDEPITIDLEAEETARTAVSEEMTERNHSDPGSSSANEVEIPPEMEKEPVAEEADEPVAEPAAEDPKAATAGEPEPPRSDAEQPSAPQRQQGATSGLIAAGIVGGLISLICVGAIQYAGLLPGGRPAKDHSADIAALTDEIDGLKQTVSNLAANPAATSDTTLAARVAALETTAANNTAASGSSGTSSGDADQKIAALSAEVDQLKASLAQATQSQASSDADVSKRLDDAEKKLNAPSQESAVARAIAAAALKAAIDRGGPFQPELDTYANVAPDDPAVADLKAFAQTGIPSRADLIRRVSDVATAIVSSTQQDDPNQSWSDRLLSSAKSLVQVRPVGNVTGDSVEAITARFEDKVKNGDLPGAITEWNSLPDAAKSASAAFKQSLEARIRVEDLVSDALSKAIADTGKQS
ncbi:mitofilin family membrane protein [Rhizobium sp. LEGMi198b]|uniref:COG4223 family protein n=1 Tax=Rhizobium sp. CB3171 TaxID=3039157 RepID=UPI0024B081E1|nr:mitofilin family membrane protein [Rhizobium sp. CB3171]WFU01445.1 mitofilin family membrane protein [Rhizobium sp. CB3171]